MVSALDTKTTVKRGSRVPIILERNEPPPTMAPPADTFRGIRGRIGPDVPPRVAYYLLQTRYQENLAGGVVQYTQPLIEGSIAQNRNDMAVRREIFLDNLGDGYVTHFNSGRQFPSPARIGAGTTETDGLVAASLWHDRGVVRRRELIALTPEWSRRVDRETRLTDLDAHVARLPSDSPSIPTLGVARGAIDAERLEAWDAPSRRYYVGYEGTHAPALQTGAYDLGFDSLRSLQSWQSWDTANFKVTKEPFFLAPEASLPRAAVGPGHSSAFEIYCGPQVFEYLVRWQTLYIIGTIWFYALVAIPQIGVFADALPVLPVPYRLAGAGQHGNNADAVSRLVEQTRTYHRMIQQDEAFQTFTAIFFIILVGRIAGATEIINLNQPLGTLCAVVKSRPGYGGNVTRYVWRRTTLVRPNTVVDILPLNTADVIGENILTVG